MLTMGVDIGSTASKAVILEDGCKVISKRVVPVGTGTRGPREVYESALAAAGVRPEEISRVVATGYGRMSFEMADRELSEVSCHGRGVRFLLPDVRTVIDIGGQDAKALLLDERGNLENFIMNDKCAAGTGRFLEVMAGALGLTTDEMCRLSEKGRGVTINSMCAVFAESEVIGLMGRGTAKEDIAYGIVDSIVNKVKTQCMRMNGRADSYYLTGGLSDNQVFLYRLSEKIGLPVRSDQNGRFAGALGAAVIGYQSAVQGGKA